MGKGDQQKPREVLTIGANLQLQGQRAGGSSEAEHSLAKLAISPNLTQQRQHKSAGFQLLTSPLDPKYKLSRME